MKKIFWLVDPFEKPGEASEAGAWVRGMSERLGIPVQPVHVLSGGALGWSPEIHAAWLMQVALQAEERIQKIVDALHLPHTLPPVVISEIYRSRSEAVSGLLDYARDNHAEIFVLQRLTGARRTGKIGGFAETLLLRSEIPILVVGRHDVRRAVRPKKAKLHGRKAARSKRMVPARVPGKILLGVDLESESTEVLDQVIRWARDMNCGIHLYHAATQGLAPAFRPAGDIMPGDWSGPVAVATAENFEADLKARRVRLERLRKHVVRHGVACTVELDSSSVRAADGILKSQRKNKIDWIAVSGKSGRWSALILGSVSRVVAREAPCPVWVVRTQEEKAKVEAAPPVARQPSRRAAA